MRRVLWIAVLLPILAGVNTAQNRDAPKPYKFAEFAAVSRSNLAFILPSFKAVLENEDARGYVVNYGNPKGIRTRVKLFLAAYNRRGPHDLMRITFVDVPTEKNLRTVIWIVPQGAEPPKI